MQLFPSDDPARNATDPHPLPKLANRPGVSYVMPVLNEREYLEAAVSTVLAQEYTGEKELVLALGPSNDGTNDIASQLAKKDPRIRLVQNPEREIPIALNLAIAASHHPVIVRVDAHTELTPDYTQLGIDALRRTGAANVGGIMRAEGRTAIQRAIAASYNSPYGLGGGTYHGERPAAAAESAYLGVFRREAIEASGGYDPGIRRGEDWELNLRIRQAGGLVWFDPRLRVTYWPRASYQDLAKQFFATGAWRAVLTRRHPRNTPWRFFAPGTLIVLLALGIVTLTLQLVGMLPWAGWWIAQLPAVGYILGVLFAATRLRGIRGWRERALGVAALVTMHVCWGAGFLYGLAGGAGRTVDSSRV